MSGSPASTVPRRAICPRILMFSCEPGGAEVLVPVIQQLKKSDRFEVVVAAYGFAADRFAKNNIQFENVSPIGENDDLAIERHSPGLVITSATSLPERDMSEKHIWAIARKLGIPSFAFVDSWQNYSQRFSGPIASQRMQYLPDRIFCIDEFCKEEMIRCGFPPDILFPLGHPSLSRLVSETTPDLQPVRDLTNPTRCSETWVFASEPIREHFGSTRGYDQYDAARVFLEIVSKADAPVKAILKLHPKDNIHGFEELLREFAAVPVEIISNQASSLEVISIADKVFGMTSIMLVEASLMGKPTISIQPHLKGEDLLVLSRRGLTPLIASADQYDENLFRANSTPMSSSFLEGIRFKGEAFLSMVEKTLLGETNSCE